MSKNTRALFLLSILLSLPGLQSDALGQRTNARRLTGTWNLDASRSDDVRNAANRAVMTSQVANPERMRQRLENRLQPPDRMAIDLSGRRVTLVSSNAPQVSFDADGRARSETNANGRTVQTTASLSGSALTIRTQGDRASDFQVTFQPVDNGRSLQVTRRMYSQRLTQPIETKSFYTRVSDVAQLDVYSDSASSTTTRNDAPGSHISDIPADTIVTATLNESLSTKDAKDQDRFTLTVTSPSQYSGAVIEGYLIRVERSGRVTGSPEIGFEFDSIRLNNSRTYDFAGYIEQVRTPNGDKVKVDNEGSVKEKSGQTERTVVRSGIGAAIGAIIGGITGGGQGAAIGAAVGAGAGAGSVIVQGRDDLELDSGTEFTIHTTSNIRISSSRFTR